MAVEYDIISQQFADSKIPEMKQPTGGRYVNFGEQNDYPDYVAMLYKKSAKHRSIINGKVTYIVGNGLVAETETPEAVAFLLNANEKQSWQEMAKIICTEIENNGGVYLQAIPKIGGIGYNFYHLPFKNMRVNEGETLFYYKKEWKKDWKTPQCFPKFVPGIKEASVFYFKEFSIDGDTYPLPSWVACCNWIESDIEVSKHTLTNAKSGFSASKFINFFNGEPDENKKRANQRRLENAATGAEGKKLLIGYNNDPAKKPTVDDLGQSDLTKEDFSVVDNLISNNIYSGHQITNAALFGVPNANHSLGGNAGAELKISFDIFKNTYSNAKQIQLENIINYFAQLAGVQATYKLKDIEPITDNLDVAQFKEMLPPQWILDKFGIDAAKYGIAPAAGVTPVQAANSILTNLTAKQHQQISRIVRQFTKEQLTKEQAALMLKNGFGFTDEDVNAYLGIDSDPATADAKFAEDFNEIDVAEMFAACGESRDNFAIIKSKCYTDDDAEFEFAFKAANETAELETKIKELIQKDPAITAIVIGELLKISVETVQALMTKLEAEGAISAVTGGVRKLLTPTKKVAVKPELLVRYSYEKRPEAPGPSILPNGRTRPFCTKMVIADKLYSRQDIQKISERLGYSVFNRGGGFWGKSTHCRHTFVSQIVIRKNK